jgi:hypothetical protein
MVDRFEEGLGKYPYVTLPQVKDYLSISSTTQDARLSNIINYATGVVEHYIGHAILANDYVEVFDGGKTSVMVSRIPLNNVYQVTEYDGVDHVTLADPTTIGTPVITDTDDLSLSFKNDAHINSRIKKFGKSSLELSISDLVASSTVPEQLKFEEGDFTIEMFIRVDDETIQDNVLFAINTDSSNYMQFRLSNANCLAFESNISGASNVVTAPNVLIESQQFAKRRWAHVAVSRKLDDEKLHLFYNGNVISDSSNVYAVSNHTFTSNVEIGTTFKGYIDELRVSDIARYTANFTPPTQRFRPDDDTVMLVHFDGKNGATETKDVHSATNEYNFSRDMGEVTRDVGAVGVRGTYPTIRNSYPALTLSGPPSFKPFPSGVRVEYRAGYESGDVPQDLQMATLDMIKMLYKQDQEKKGFSFEGERGDNYALSSNFPPHIRRILDLYRVIQ